MGKPLVVLLDVSLALLLLAGCGGDSTMAGAGGSLGTVCIATGGNCMGRNNDCCNGLTCAFDPAANYYACASICTTSADCISGCCNPLTPGPGAVCAPAVPGRACLTGGVAGGAGGSGGSSGGVGGAGMGGAGSSGAVDWKCNEAAGTCECRSPAPASYTLAACPSTYNCCLYSNVEQSCSCLSLAEPACTNLAMSSRETKVPSCPPP